MYTLPLTILAMMSFALGAIFGSFLLVVTVRYGTGKSLQGRSHCFSCGTTLKWYELIPILSYLSQRGRCRTCSSHIPLETIAVEVFTAVLFTLLALRGLFVGNVEVIFTFPYLIATLFLFLLFSILTIIFFYDFRHKIIPDIFSLAFGVIALIAGFFFSIEGGVFLFTGLHIPTLWYLAGGILVPLPFYLIWLFSKGRLIGLGDPKLMVGIGLFFGVIQGLTAVIVSFWIGTLAIIAMLIIQKVLSKKLFERKRGGIMKQEVPFGPFLILGTLVTLIFNLQLF